MDKLEKIICDYIDLEKSDSAILIDSEWGHGKTYYIKEILIPSLKYKYKEEKSILYISLNGLSSLDEISDRILLSKFAKEEKSNFGWGLLKSSVKFASTANVGDEANIFQTLFKTFAGTGKDAITEYISRKSVIFIDDLERVSDKIGIIDVLGYLNSNYIEQNHTKIILVCDESKILEAPKYNEIKEKSISISVKFEQDMSIIIPGLFKIYENLEPDKCFKFLHDNQVNIISMITYAEIKNLRTVIFIFTSFYKVFKSLKKTYSGQVLLQIFQFILVISNEIKIGKIPSQDPNEHHKLESPDLYKRWKINLGNKAKEEGSGKEYFEIVKEKYLDKTDIEWMFIKSIYSFLFTHYLDDEALNAECESHIIAPIPAIDALKEFEKAYRMQNMDILPPLQELIKYIDCYPFSLDDSYKLSRVLSEIKPIYSDLYDFDKLINCLEVNCLNYIKSISDFEELRDLKDRLNFSHNTTHPLFNVIDSALKKADTAIKDQDAKNLIITYLSENANYLASTAVEYHDSLIKHRFFEFIWTYDLTYLLNKISYACIRMLSKYLQNVVMMRSDFNISCASEFEYIRKTYDYIKQNNDDTNERWKKVKLNELYPIFDHALSLENKVN